MKYLSSKTALDEGGSLEWYRKAAEQGDDDARERIEPLLNLMSKKPKRVKI